MAHYYESNPLSKVVEKQITSVVFNKHISFFTGAGLFSLDHIDDGSKLLIEESQIPADTSVLDLGCGWGAVGISLLRERPDIKMTCVDINEQAIKFTKKNLQLNHLEATVLESDGFVALAQIKFDVILLNPPQSAGKDVCLRLIQDAKLHLNAGGSLQIVARKAKGGASLAAYMDEVYGNVEIIARDSGFSIWKSIVA